MQASNPQHYLIKNSKNISFFFYLDKHKILNYKTYGPENIFIDNQQLFPGAIHDFSVTIDAKDQIHLICITKEGNLLYFIDLQNRWEHKLLAKLDFKSNAYKHLTLLQRKDYTHVFCNKTNLLNPMITSIEHMYWNDKAFNKGTITTYLPGKYHAPFQVDIDSMNNVHLIYKVLHRNNHQLSYCKFNAFNKKWSTGEIITNLQEDNSHPFLLIDKKDNLHLTWCTIIENNFSLKYRRKSSIINQKSKWSQVAQLSNKNANYLSPLLIQEGNTIKLLSKQNGHINEIVSEDYGITWTPINKGISYKIENALLLQYRSNSANEKKYYTAPFVYGYADDELINVICTRLYSQKEKNPIDIHSETINSPVPAPKLELPPEEVNVSPNVELNVTSNPIIDEGISPKTNESEYNDVVEATEESSNINDDMNYFNQVLRDEHIIIDSNLKTMIQDVQSYVNKMVTEIEKLEASKKSPSENISSSGNDAPKDVIHTELHQQLKELDSQLIDLEDEQLKLEFELGEFHKKIYNIEERLITYKKQFMELEEKTYQSLQSNSSIVNRVINFFK